MVPLDPDRFFVVGKWLAIAIAAAFAAGWFVLVDRPRPVPRERRWYAAVLLAVFALLILVTPYNFSGEACQNPHLGSSDSSTAELDSCSLSSAPLLLAAAMAIATAAALLARGRPDDPDADGASGADAEVERYRPGAP